jgi:NAD(P)-dependent dehydrogenase (short-subunit alcohol dehydrogenase family)
MSVDDFAGKVAIVTGGGSGIGEACATLFTQRGARVLIADRDLDAARRVVKELGDATYAAPADVSDPAACEAMVAEAIRVFGRLDIAVNNAGIPGAVAPTAGIALDVWDGVLAVNLSGTFYSMRAEIPAILATGGGAIVNIASVLGCVGAPGNAAYVSAKHGVIGLTKTAALDYARLGIRVNAVAPGYIATPMLSANTAKTSGGMGRTPLGRLGQADDVAKLVAFLASDQAGNITGSCHLTDGGYAAR